MTEYILELEEEAPLPTCQTTDFIETVISISNVLTVVNSAANFLIYMLRGKKFRDLFLQTYFSKCIQRSQDPSYRANDSLPAGQVTFHSTKCIVGPPTNTVKSIYATTQTRIESEFTANTMEMN